MLFVMLLVTEVGCRPESEAIVVSLDEYRETPALAEGATIPTAAQ